MSIRQLPAHIIIRIQKNIGFGTINVVLRVTRSIQSKSKAINTFSEQLSKSHNIETARLC